MSIDRLIDDCLFLIFEQLYNFDDLINCHNVCLKWRDLITIRLAKFRYVTIFDGARSPSIEGKRIPNELLINFKTLDFDLAHRARWNRNYYCPLKSLGPEMLPNLKIMHIDENIGKRVYYFIHTDLIKIFDTTPLKGLLELVLNKSYVFGCQDREMYGSLCSIPSGPKLKQLRIHDCNIDLLKNLKPETIPNLKILYLNVISAADSHLIPRLIFPNLETLIVSDADKKSLALRVELELINSCPKLKSAHFYLRYKHVTITGDEVTRNNHLEDLVIVFGPGSTWMWPSLKTQLTKYPKLRNLAIRIYPDICDANVRDLVEMLPNLVTLDLRECENITDSSMKFIDNFNRLKRRSIKLLIAPKKPGPPQAGHWLGIGSDFMETFFYRNQAPLIVDEFNDDD